VVFRSRGTVRRLRQETDAEEHRRVLFEIGGTARTLFGKDKKRRKPDTGQNAAARCFLTNLKLLT